METMNEATWPTKKDSFDRLSGAKDRQSCLWHHGQCGGGNGVGGVKTGCFQSNKARMRFHLVQRLALSGPFSPVTSPARHGPTQLAFGAEPLSG